MKRTLTVTIHVEIDRQLIRLPSTHNLATTDQVRRQLLDQLHALPALRQAGVTSRIEVTS